MNAKHRKALLPLFADPINGALEWDRIGTLRGTGGGEGERTKPESVGGPCSIDGGPSRFRPSQSPESILDLVVFLVAAPCPAGYEHTAARCLRLHRIPMDCAARRPSTDFAPFDAPALPDDAAGEWNSVNFFLY